MNRGSVRILPNEEYRRIASMRPRFMNRGSARQQHYIDRIPVASMRPRFMNRGSRSISDTIGHRDARFNEAPIHESGKYAHI